MARRNFEAVVFIRYDGNMGLCSGLVKLLILQGKIVVTPDTVPAGSSEGRMKMGELTGTDALDFTDVKAKEGLAKALRR